MDGISKPIQTLYFGIKFKTSLIKDLNVSILYFSYFFLPVGGCIGNRCKNTLIFLPVVLIIFFQLFFYSVKFLVKGFDLFGKLLNVLLFYFTFDWPTHLFDESHLR